MTAPAEQPASERPVRTDDGATAELLAQKLVEVLEGVDAAASDEQRAELTQLAGQVLSAPTESRRTLLTDLRVRVQQVGEAVLVRREQLARAQVLLGSLQGLEGSAVADERSLLEDVARGRRSLTSADVQRIGAVHDQAVAEQERRFVAERLSRALSGLGYQPADGFLADVRAGRAGFALVGASEEHAVRVEIIDGVLDYGLVRTVDGDDADRDRELEGELCGGMGRFMASVQPEGIAFRFQEHREPGSRPLEVSGDAAQIARGHRRASQPRLR